MTFLSLFAGIEGFGLGLARAGMECVGQIEQDATCLNILVRHFPAAPRFPDVRKFDAGSIAIRPELICGGFPCQDLSVAGKRAGLAGKRSGLWREFRRIISELAPRWVLIENVPGLLSSNGGRDMGTVLGGLGELGYGFAYRVLDAQWFGLAQRRKRVFIVGCLGNVRRACQVLFESQSLPWHNSTREAAGQRVAHAVAAGSGGSKFGSGRGGQDDFVIAGTLTGGAEGGKSHGKKSGTDREGFLVAGTLGGGNRGWNDDLDRAGAFVCGALRIGGGVDDNAVQANQLVCGTLDSQGGGPCIDRVDQLVPMVFDERNVTSKDNRSACRPGDPVPTMHEKSMAIAYAIQEKQCQKKTSQNADHALSADLSASQSANSISVSDVAKLPADASLTRSGGLERQLTGGGANANAVAFQTRIARNGRGQPKEITDTLTSSEGGTHADSKPHVALPSGVRRLTAKECERLQGFPDGYTAYGADGKQISDSARYRVLGNAVCPPVSEWIARRILDTERT